MRLDDTLDDPPVSKHDLDDGRIESLYWLAAGTAHDVNNLLMVVIGCAEMALDDESLKPHTRQLVEEIVGAGERAGLLTRQFRSVGRPAESSTAVVNVTQVLQGAELLLRRLAGSRVKLSLVPCEAPQWVRADASQLEQIVVNLALNARDAMPSGGSLTITVSEVTEQRPGSDAPDDRRCLTRVTVSDTGTGIDPAIQGRIFEAFVTTKSLDEGSGLGLAVVRAIVEQLGGTIHMTTAPGHGTTFAIDLPRVPAPA